MNNNERCSNCSFYPLCKKCAGPLAWCENWKKRKIGSTEDFDDWLIDREESIEWNGGEE